MTNGVYAWVMLAILLTVTWYNVEILVFYNMWNKEFYDSIQTLQEERFWQLFWSFDMFRMWDLITLKEGTIPSFLEIVILYTPISTKLENLNLLYNNSHIT